MPSFILHLDSCKYLFEKFKLRRKGFDFTLAAIGSVIVDLDEFGVVGRMHGRSKQFLKYLLKTDPKYAFLAVGMILHEQLDHAMDSHFINPQLSKAVALLEKHNMKCKAVYSIGHHLIDHSIDCAKIEENPQLVKIMKRLKKIKHRHLHKIAYHISTFFNGEPKAILAIIERFKNFDVSQVLSAEKIAELYSLCLFFANQDVKIKRLTFFEKLKLVFNYFKFVFSHKKQETKQLILNAKELFKNYTRAYSKAKQNIVRVFKRASFLKKGFSQKTYKLKSGLKAQWVKRKSLKSSNC